MERKLIAIAVASAMGLPMAAGAVEGSVSGHVNATFTKVDDGDGKLGSGSGSETRFKFTGSEDLDNGLTAGVTLEVGAGGGLYGYGSYHEHDDQEGKYVETKDRSSSDFRVRLANVSLSSAAGKVTVGQAWAPSFGANYADVGLSWLAGVTNWCSYGIGGGPACATNDAARRQIVRYDSPALGPVSLSASAGNGDFWDAAATVSGSAGDASYDLRLGYNGTKGSEDLIASGSVTVGSTGVAVAWSQGEYMDAEDPTEMVLDNESMYVKLDHTYGDGSIGVYYRRGEDDTGEGSLWGIGVAHELGGDATVYAGYRVVDNDGEDETDGMLAGIRVQFN